MKVPKIEVVNTVGCGDSMIAGFAVGMSRGLSMEETIRQLRALPDPPVTFVGGAVVTPEYAQQMGADYYAKDARQSVEIAREVLG